MAFTNYTIVPTDLAVVLDGVYYDPVDMTGIPADVHAIQWFGARSEGSIEYKVNPVTGVLPDPGTFTDPADYYNQTQACEDPLVVYALADNTTYGTQTYSAGQELIIYQWPHPPVPTGFTEVQPLGSLPPQSTWQWDGSSWIASPFPITYNLSEAQEYLTAQVNLNASSLVNSQLRNYSIPQLLTAPDINALLTVDSVSSAYPTLGQYRTALDAIVSPKLSDISAATAVEDLYTFDPSVSAP